MAGGKGSRMSDITAGKPKCLLPVANFPLVWFPLKMLQNNGFQEAIVVVPESAKNEVARIPDKFGLNIRLDVVGIPGQEEWGTADTIRHISDKISGSDILIVSGDLILDQGVRGVADLHRQHRSALTALFSHSGLDPKTVEVPGPKSTKHRKEKDLVGLDGQRLCLFTAEADIEDEVTVKNKVLRLHPRITVHTNLQDAHLYIVKKWVCDYICSDKTVSTIKGEVLPRLVKKQFSNPAKSRLDTYTGEFVPRADVCDFVPTDRITDLVKTLSGDEASEKDKHRYGCYGYVTSSGECLRVNSLVAYWEAHRRAAVRAIGGVAAVHPSATVGQRAQVTSCQIGSGSVVSDKTTLTDSVLGANCTVEEKVKISNCVIMDNVTISSGSNLYDSIICDNCTIGPGCEVKMSILGRGQEVQAETSHAHQLLLDRDRMMEV